MNKNICFKVWQVAFVAFLLLIGVLIFKPGCGNKFKSQQAQIDSLTLALQTRDSMINKKGQTIITQQAIISSDQASIKELTKNVFDLKKKYEKKIKQVIAYYTQQTHTHLDSVKVPYVDSATAQQFSDSLRKECAEIINYMEANTITVPRRAILDTAGAHIDLSVTRQSVSLNSLSIVDSQYVRIVEKKGGFFRKVNGKLKFHVPKTIEFQSFHTSPLITVTGQNSILYQPNSKPKILEKLILVGAGVFLGLQF